MADLQWQRLNLDGATRRRFRRIRRLSQVKRMDPVLFEHFVGYLYAQEGYRVYTTVATGDEGVDLFLRRPFRSIVVQCKRYAGTVGQPVVRDLYGAMIHNRANGALLVTSGTFSQAAEEWAQGKRIELVDGHELMSRARRHRLGLTRPLLTLVQLAALLLLLLLCSSALLLSQDRLQEAVATWLAERPTVAVPTAGTPQPGATATPTTTATTTPSPSATPSPQATPTLFLEPPPRPTVVKTPGLMETLAATRGIAPPPSFDR